jgi:hypothetical protein
MNQVRTPFSVPHLSSGPLLSTVVNPSISTTYTQSASHPNKHLDSPNKHRYLLGMTAAAISPPDAPLDPEDAARWARIKASHAGLFAAQERCRAIQRTLDIARDLTNPSRALRACQALIRGEPLIESPRRRRNLPLPEGGGRGEGEPRASTTPSPQLPAPPPPTSEPQASACGAPLPLPEGDARGGLAPRSIPSDITTPRARLPLPAGGGRGEGEPSASAAPSHQVTTQPSTSKPTSEPQASACARSVPLPEVRGGGARGGLAPHSISNIVPTRLSPPAAKPRAVTGTPARTHQHPHRARARPHIRAPTAHNRPAPPRRADRLTAFSRTAAPHPSRAA